ncbi:MAG: sulfatase-like hydrolase/transferase [Candidatus Binataceae bacterium]
MDNDSNPDQVLKDLGARDTSAHPVADGAKTSNPANAITRRRLLRMGAGTGLAAVIASSAGSAPAFGAGETRDVPATAGRHRAARFPAAPNIIVLMTDQERHHMHWPAGWAEKNLPAMQRLKRNGLYFNRAYTAACQCSPSRALMMTGRFAPVNRVTRTFLWPGPAEKNRQPNIASLLKQKAGYEVVWKGKWHLSYAANATPGNGGEDWSSTDIKVMEERYGWSGWNPPDGGNAIERWQPTQFGKFDGLATLGGANPDNDGRYINGLNPSRPGQTPGFGESVYLNTVADKHVMTVLDTLEETGLMDKTVVLRMADHGEGGLSHGMREKAYTVYEEMIHIPLIVHNPKLFPEPVQTEAFYDHLDLLPTILDLAGISDPNSYALGESIVPVIKNPSAAVKEHTAFSFDDLFFLPAGFPGAHIRDSGRGMDLCGLPRAGRQRYRVRAVQHQKRPASAQELALCGARPGRQEGVVAPASDVDRAFCRRRQPARCVCLADRAGVGLKG